jgi:hypothetical protein
MSTYIRPENLPPNKNNQIYQHPHAQYLQSQRQQKNTPKPTQPNNNLKNRQNEELKRSYSGREAYGGSKKNQRKIKAKSKQNQSKIKAK